MFWIRPLRDIREVLLEKLTVVQLCKNSQEFYEIRRLITVFTKALRTGPYPEPDETCPHPHIRPGLFGPDITSEIVYAMFTTNRARYISRPSHTP
jgi:hypothetical protein